MTNKISASRKNILVVDDTQENLKFMVKILGDEGYNVRPALNGELAITAARKKTPDLILLDIMMPVMNGYQVAEKLKKDKRLKDVPIIFISALDTLEDKVKSFSAGGVDYVTKPFQEKELLARIKTHLTLQKLKKDLKNRNNHLEQINTKLQSALDEIKTLKGILPICASCKKIRDDSGYWNQIEEYIQNHSEAEFSHGLCPECSEKLYGEEEWYIEIKNQQK
ncbi:response regulator [Desulfobacula toluolica]|uniref:Two component system response regulator n=1 Tax=Desulfobacula toluolica (strain DSM 7467 / Tol2) TaxID=651182 RepID=K0N4X8_DESTT|nr:response regulator [Desulfobacula toluolica]CCK79174.1 two component system response regulator [Desulfobacula toluolica Tol2]